MRRLIIQRLSPRETTRLVGIDPVVSAFERSGPFSAGGAAAMALPSAFPDRDVIVLTAFAVVLGTLVIQGLTLEPLLRVLDLHDDDPVGRELTAARERALRAGLASLANDRSPVAETVRKEFSARLADERADGHAGRRSAHPSIVVSSLLANRV